MKSVVISSAPCDRKEVLSVALCAAEVISAASAAAPVAVEADAAAAVKEEEIVVPEHLLFEGDVKSSNNKVATENGDATPEPLVEDPEEEGMKFNYFDMLRSTLEAFKGKEDFTVDDLLKIVTVAGTRKAQEKISDTLELYDPFKPVEGPQVNDDIKAAHQCLIDNNMEEFQSRLHALIDNASEEMVKVALPEPLQDDAELKTDSDRFNQFMKGIKAQLKQSQFAFRSQRLAMEVREAAAVVKEDQRVAVLTEAKLEPLIPQLDSSMLAAKQLLENPETAKLVLGGGADGPEVSGDVFDSLSSSDAAAAPQQQQTPVVEDVTATA